MATAQATLGNFRQAPRKMRMVANTVRGKKVSDALVNLDFVAKKAAFPIKTLLLSALANAKNLGIPTDNLVVKKITVDGGSILYRRRPAARGSAHPIRKRTSSVFIELGEPETKVNSEQASVKIPKEKTVKTEKHKVERKSRSKKSTVNS